MAASHSGSFVIQSSLAQVNALICDADFLSGTGLTFASHTPLPNQITFVYTTGVTFTSWGEIITITIAATSAEQVLMTIHSECAMPTQIVDWGKNKDNVNRIINYVTQNIGRYTTVAPAATPVPAAAPVPAATAAPAQRFCQYCGNRLVGGEVFCTQCGQKL